METVSNGCLAYMASLISTYGLYPYRDFVKAFDLRHMPSMDAKHFCLSRYRGMAKNPSQPLLLAAPQGMLYFGYTLGGYGVSGAFMGGLLMGLAKTFVGTVARRMNGVGGGYNQLQHKHYTSLLDCVYSSAKQFGTLSFFAGGAASSIIAILWHGLTLFVLQRTVEHGFWENFWDAFRTHALFSFFTSPVRNTLRSAMSPRERSGGVHSIQQYMAGESAIFVEGAGVLRSMFRTEGISFFMSGSLRVAFKTSVPFAFTYAVFRAVGGTIGPPVVGHGPQGGRHVFRRWNVGSPV